jgi:SAM-dependent methyltransferase
MEPEEFRRMMYEIAQATAPGWGSERAFIEEVVAPVRQWMLRELQPQPGDTVLELAAGAGDTGFEAAAAVGERGRLISTDFAPAMLDLARRRGAELGVETVDYRLMDAERIDLETDSVDAVLCRFGYMLMPDPAAALSDTRRVLRPGGRVALAVWGPPDRNPFFSITGMTLVERGHMPPPDPDGPGPFSMASPERTRGLLDAAGFDSVHTEEVAVRFAFRDIDDYLTRTSNTAGPIGLALGGLSDDEHAAVREALEGALTPFAVNGGYVIPGVALVAVAG